MGAAFSTVWNAVDPTLQTQIQQIISTVLSSVSIKHVEESVNIWVAGE